MAFVFAMSDEEIFAFLNKNASFRDLNNEFNGKFNCDYIVNGWVVQISNHTDSWISSYLHPYDFNTNRDSFYIASAFGKRAEVLLNGKLFRN